MKFVPFSFPATLNASLCVGYFWSRVHRPSPSSSFPFICLSISLYLSSNFHLYRCFSREREPLKIGRLELSGCSAGAVIFAMSISWNRFDIVVFYRNLYLRYCLPTGRASISQLFHLCCPSFFLRTNRSVLLRSDGQRSRAHLKPAIGSRLTRRGPATLAYNVRSERNKKLLVPISFHLARSASKKHDEGKRKVGKNFCLSFINIYGCYKPDHCRVLPLMRQVAETNLLSVTARENKSRK